MRIRFHVLAISAVLSLCGIAQAASEAEEVVTMGDGIQAPRKTSSTGWSKSARSAERRGDWRFPVGLTYISGMQDMVDYAKDKMNGDTDLYIPIGLSFAPYYEFAHGSRIGFDLGPGTIITFENQYGSDSDTLYWGVPIALSYGFTFIPQASVSPYARIGFKYYIAGGDWLDKSSPGLFAAAGVEFLRKKAIAVGFEVGYDNAEVEFEDGETFTPGDIQVSLRAVF